MFLQAQSLLPQNEELFFKKEKWLLGEEEADDGVGHISVPDMFLPVCAHLKPMSG